MKKESNTTIVILKEMLKAQADMSLTEGARKNANSIVVSTMTRTKEERAIIENMFQ